MEMVLSRSGSRKLMSVLSRTWTALGGSLVRRQTFGRCVACCEWFVLVVWVEVRKFWLQYTNLNTQGLILSLNPPGPHHPSSRNASHDNAAKVTVPCKPCSRPARLQPAVRYRAQEAPYGKLGRPIRSANGRRGRRIPRPGLTWSRWSRSWLPRRLRFVAIRRAAPGMSTPCISFHRCLGREAELSGQQADRPRMPPLSRQ